MKILYAFLLTLSLQFQAFSQDSTLSKSLLLASIKSNEHFALCKKIYLQDRPKNKKLYPDSALLILNQIDSLFNKSMTLFPKSQAKLKSHLAGTIKKNEVLKQSLTQIKTISKIQDREVLTEKICVEAGNLVTSAYYTYLNLDNVELKKVKHKGKLPLADSLAHWNVDKSVYFSLLKSSIKYNNELSANMKELKLVIPQVFEREEKAVLQDELLMLEKEKEKNDKLLIRLTQKIEQTRINIATSLIPQAERSEFDKDKDGKISIEEVYFAIEDYLDNTDKYKLETIQQLIENFFLEN